MSELTYQRDSKKPIYVSTSVYRALWLISRKYNESTLDERANGILRTELNKHFPQLFEHQKKVEQLEKELLKTL